MTFFSRLTRYRGGNRFLHFGFLLTALHISGGALGYLYQILMGRILQPTEFSLFSAVMALSMFISAPLNAMSMIIVRKVSEIKAHENLFFIKSLFTQVNKILLFLAVVIFCLFGFLKQPFQHYLRIENSSITNLFIAVIVFSIFNVVGLSFFQGLQRFICLGILGLSGVIGKILFSLGFIHYGLGVEGALLGVLMSMMINYLITIRTLFSSLPQQVPYKNIRIDFSSIKKFFPVMVATTTFAAMTQLDMTIINWYFPPEEAGLYAAASVLGKAVLYLPGGLILVLFPMVSEKEAKSSESFGIFHQAVISTILLCGFIALIYYIYGDFIISILYGDSYEGAGKILSWYGIAILPLAIVVIAEHYLIAKGQVLFSWLFVIMLPLELFAIYCWHTSMWMILLIMGIFGLALVIIGYALMWQINKSQKFI